MKLTKEEIQFIDTYLENSDVIYADIRLEMVDHIASALETELQNSDITFYDAFKAYMVKHKATLLDNNIQFLKTVDCKLIKQIGQNLFKFKSLVYLTIAMFVLYNLNTNNYLQEYIQFIPLIAFFCFLILYGFYKGVNSKNRFASVERMAFPFLILFQFFNFLYNLLLNEDETIYLFCLSVFLTITVVYCKIVIKSFRTLKQRHV